MRAAPPAAGQPVPIVRTVAGVDGHGGIRRGVRHPQLPLHHGSVHERQPHPSGEPPHWQPAPALAALIPSQVRALMPALLSNGAFLAFAASPAVSLRGPAPQSLRRSHHLCAPGRGQGPADGGRVWHRECAHLQPADHCGGCLPDPVRPARTQRALPAAECDALWGAPPAAHGRGLRQCPALCAARRR